MLKWSDGAALRAAGLGLAAALLAPAATADIFAWRTEDGVYAYTDDRKKVPARYADEAVRVPDSKLGNYERLTEEDTAASRAVSERMQSRLEYLRTLNAAAPAPRAAAAPAPRSSVSVATGDPRVPTIDVEADPASGPVVVEPILTKETGKSRTRRTTLVKQGDRTIAVIKGRSHHYDVNRDIHDEDDLLR